MISKNILDNINKIKEDYNNSIDISFRDFLDSKITIVFSSALCSSDFICDFIIKNISNAIKDKKFPKTKILSFLKNTIQGCEMKELTNYNDIYTSIGNGFAILLIDNIDVAIAIEARQDLTRGVNQPVTEQAISGPKDSFNESYFTNIGLIRKRIKTNNLVVEEKIIGKESQTKVGIIYMKDIIETELLDEVKHKLDKINIDGILDATYIKDYIESKNSVFSLVQTTERPDVCSMQLLNGKICIIVENSPFVLIIPTFFLELFNASEDYYQKSKNVTFTRIIRYISFFVAILLPAFYIAITTFNHETIPDTLLINFAIQREGVPFPAFIEALGMILVFEILRESDIRMPSLSGSAISILGAIVLGDAAVSAGVVSPIMVIVIAISAICSLMFSGPAMTNGIRFWRIIFMIFATFFGIAGIAFCGVIFTIIMCDMKSFGKPYLYPFAPFNFKLALKTIFKQNIKKQKLRNPLLTNTNYKRSSK